MVSTGIKAEQKNLAFLHQKGSNIIQATVFMHIL